jgi:hypothetical protein
MNNNYPRTLRVVLSRPKYQMAIPSIFWVDWILLDITYLDLLYNSINEYLSAGILCTSLRQL